MVHSGVRLSDCRTAVFLSTSIRAELAVRPKASAAHA